MDRRTFIKQSALGLGALALGRAPRAWTATQAAPARKPDVLFMMIEGTPPTRHGTWGNPICKTPNIDRLAAQGLRFDLAQCMCPPCNPARTSLLLGMRPENTKTFSNGTDWRKLHPGILTMPQHFRQNGYETIECGKIFHGSFDTKESWDGSIPLNQGLPAPTHRRRALVGPDAGRIDEMKAAKRQEKAQGKAAERGKAAAAAKGGGGAAAAEDDDEGGGRGGVPFLYGPSGLDDIEEHDGMVAEQGVRVLGQPHDKPLFLALGFTRPHLPYSCPDKYFAMYPPEKIELPKNPVQDVPKSRDQTLVNDQTWREAIAAFYACLTFADACIGRVLDALD
ncbi:MAG: sulfatase-like hydrolase/transferase, partial [Candidatus Sumerlaeota bacterium]|nr:sulfatase-like hydrolase/transferase [Candidatus Sumerlaeota bacterium]